MIILGIDPGATTGWCLYDSGDRHVIEWGHFPGHAVAISSMAELAGVVVVERLRPHGASFPQVVEAAYTAGRIVERFACSREYGCEGVVHEVLRDVVRKTLQEATHGAVKVKDDKSVWAALVLLHGEGSDRKPKKRKGVVVEEGGAIGGVTSHARAALAVAVAFALREKP